MKRQLYIDAIKGSHVSYELMKDKMVKPYGEYVGGHSDRWAWNHKVDKLTAIEATELYTLIRESR